MFLLPEKLKLEHAQPKPVFINLIPISFVETPPENSGFIIKTSLILWMGKPGLGATSSCLISVSRGYQEGGSFSGAGPGPAGTPHAHPTSRPSLDGSRGGEPCAVRTKGICESPWHWVWMGRGGSGGFARTRFLTAGRSGTRLATSASVSLALSPVQGAFYSRH